MWPKDLTRNGISFDHDVIFALDKKERNEQLMRFYPERSFWRYERPPGESEGSLTRMN